MCADTLKSGSLQRIVLTGFMGSGKTTTGQRLAERLRWTFTDLDTAVEAQAGQSVPEIFAGQGEAAFRRMEADVLSVLLNTGQHVIALGGGAPGSSAIRDMLRTVPGTAVVYLQAPFEVLYGRCQKQALDPHATPRPLLGARGMAERRYRERETLYQALATSTVDVSFHTPEAVAERVLSSLPPGYSQDL